MAGRAREARTVEVAPKAGGQRLDLPCPRWPCRARAPGPSACKVSEPALKNTVASERADPGRKVGVAVVALRKERDAVHVRATEGRRKAPRIRLGADGRGKGEWRRAP